MSWHISYHYYSSRIFKNLRALHTFISSFSGLVLCPRHKQRCLEKEVAHSGRIRRPTTLGRFPRSPISSRFSLSLAFSKHLSSSYRHCLPWRQCHAKHENAWFFLKLCDPKNALPKKRYDNPVYRGSGFFFFLNLHPSVCLLIFREKGKMREKHWLATSCRWPD